MKHRVLQSEVVVKTSQVVVEVLRHQHVWNEGEAGLHGQDVRSQRKRDVAQEVRQHGGGGSFHRCRGSCCWNCGGERCRVLWLSWVAAGGLWGKAGVSGLLKVISWLQMDRICCFQVFNCRFFFRFDQTVTKQTMTPKWRSQTSTDHKVQPFLDPDLMITGKRNAKRREDEDAAIKTSCGTGARRWSNGVCGPKTPETPSIHTDDNNHSSSSISQSLDWI